MRERDDSAEKEVHMGLGTSLFLIAVGAVLRFAVHVTTHGFNLHTIGVILIVVGAIGLIISLIWMASAGRRRERVVRYDDRGVPPAGVP
jgi:putative Mn2+ efflux pump MntP